MKHKAQDALIKVLENGIDVHRCAAARTLGVLDTTGARDHLTRALLDEDPDVRVDAATSLAALADPTSAEQLMENLIGDPETDVKKQAIEALVAMRHEPVIPLLRKLVVDRTDEIYWDEDEFYHDEWDSWVDIQMQAIRLLGELGDRDAVPMILQALSDEEGQNVEPVAIPALARMGAEGAAALVDLAASASPLRRLRIAETLAEADNLEAGALEDVLLADASPAVRIAAMRVLAPDDARIAQLFEDPAPEVRKAAVEYAGAHFPEQTAGRMNDADTDVRAAAFYKVADHPDLFRSKENLKLVREGIAEDPKAASAAALAWVRLRGAKGIKGLSHVMVKDDLPLEYRRGVVRALEAAGPVATQHLLPAVGDDARQLRLDAMTALLSLAKQETIWPNPAAEGLLAALRGELVPQPEEEEEELEPVEAELPEEDEEEVRAQEREIDESLPLVPEEGSTLDAILSPAPADTPEEEPEAEVDPELARLLEISEQNRIGKNKVPLDVQIAPHLDVRRFAATLLGGLDNPEVTEALTDVLTDQDAELAEAALNSLVEIGERNGSLPAETLEVLEQVMARGIPQSRVLAVRAMGYVDGEDAIARLHELLEDEADFIRLEAIRGLSRHGIAPDLLVDLLADKYPGVALAAAKSLLANRGADAVDDLVRFACMRDGTYRTDVGRWLAETAPEAGAQGFLNLLADEGQKINWLVALDALAEILPHVGDEENLQAA